MGAPIPAIAPIPIPQSIYAGVFDGDVIFSAQAEVGNVSFGLVYLDGLVTVPSMTQLTFSTDFGGPHVVYGGASGNLRFLGGSRGLMASGTFAAGWTAPTLITGVTINAGTTASCNTGADPGVIHNASDTVAHLDSACGAGTGLGGNAFNLGGATLTNVQ